MTDRLREIQERVNAATEGPWHQGQSVQTSESGVWFGRWHGLIARTDIGHSDFDSSANAAFIAHAREDVPWLLAERASARAREEQLREALRRIERIAAEHDGVSPEAYELITDETRAARDPEGQTR